MTTKIVADRIRIVCTTGKSRKKIASTTSLPMPGHAKIDSVITAPPSSVPICRPSTVSSGMVALRSAWCSTTRRSPRPLARPVRMYSWPRISSGHALDHDRERRRAVLEGLAEVAAHDAAQKDPVLHPQRLAQAEVTVQRLHRGLRGALGQQHLGGITRDDAQDDEDENRDADERDRGLPEPP